jgi:DNA adenine methylase
MAGAVSKYLSAIDRLPQIHERLRTALIDHDDFRTVIQRYDLPDAFFYCDPPYVISTRVGGKEFKYEMTDEDHRELVDLLIGIQGMTMVSGYRNEIYDQLEAVGFIRKDWKAKATVTKPKDGKLPKRTESVWLCPKTQQRLKEN